jgi:hypothetical protein
MNPPKVLTWEADVRLMTHPLMLINFVKLFALTGAIMAALMSFILAVTGQAGTILPMLGLIGLCLGIVMALFVFVSLAIFRNRMHLCFCIDGKSAQAAVGDKRADVGNRLAMAAGALAGKPGVTGAGLIGLSSGDQKIVWSAVEKVRYHPACRAIALCNGWRTMVTLFCTAGNYADVAAAVAAALAARPPRVRSKSPLPKFLLRTVLVVLAATPLFLLPDLDEGAILPALLVLAFALTEVWLIPLAAWAVFAGLAWLAVLEAAAMTEVRQSMFGETYSGYEVLSGDETALLVLAGAGAGALVWLSVGYLRGRIESALLGDRGKAEE